MAFSPDSRQLTVQGNDSGGGGGGGGNRLLRFDARTGHRLGGSRLIPGRYSRLLGFVGPGSRPVTSSVADDATVIRDPVTLRGQRRFPIASRLAALNPALGVIAFAARDGTVHLLDIDTGRLRVARGRHDGPVTAMAFSADGHRLVTAGRDEQPDRVGHGPRDCRRDASSARRRPDPGCGGRRGRPDRLHRRPRRDRRHMGPAGHATTRASAHRGREPAGGAAGRPRPDDGSRFAVAGPTGSIAVFDGRTQRLTGRVRTGRRRPSGVALSPDGRTLAVTDADGRLGFWDAATGRQLGALQYAYATRRG